VINSFYALEFCVKTLAGVKIIPFIDKALVGFKKSEYRLKLVYACYLHIRRKHDSGPIQVLTAESSFYWCL